VQRLIDCWSQKTTRLSVLSIVQMIRLAIVPGLSR
jgi:hypothetical protein